MAEHTISTEERADLHLIEVHELPTSIPASKLLADSITSAQLDEGVLKTAEVLVTSAELLAINATPKVLVAAQADKIVEFISAVLILDYNSLAYANNGLLGIYETDASGALLSGTTTLAAFLAKTADTVIKLNPAADATPSVVPQALLPNKDIVLTQDTGESITGDSPVRVKVAYRVWDADLA